MMTKILNLLVLLISFTALAETDSSCYSLFPRVVNFGSQAQVQIWNSTDERCQCSGPIYLYSSLGQSYTEYYFDVIQPKMTSYRSFYLFSNLPGDMISSASHGISCF